MDDLEGTEGIEAIYGCDAYLDLGGMAVGVFCADVHIEGLEAAAVPDPLCI